MSVLLLKYSVHFISVTEQIKIKFVSIVIFMTETVTCVVEKIICYVACVEERKTYRILVQKCGGMR
jgi:hypothetical protein